MTNKTDTEKSSYVFRWKIENGLWIENKDGEAAAIKSPVFTPENFWGSKWYIMFMYKRCDRNPNISCCLCRNDDDSYEEEIFISPKFEFIDENDKRMLFNGDIYQAIQVYGKGAKSECFSLNSWDVARDGLTWNEEIITIECRMSVTRKVSKCEARTKISLETFYFKWKLNASGNCSTVQERTFSFPEKAQYEICVTLNVQENCLRLIGKKVGKKSTGKFLKGKISAINQKGEECLSMDSFFDFSTGVMQVEPASRFLPFNWNIGIFTFSFEFTMPNDIKSSDIIDVTRHDSNKLSNVSSLQNDFAHLFASKEFSDVELRTENVCLPAHKIVLAARSPVFRAMFHQDMTEKQSGVVEIFDVDSNTLKSFLEFLYTGVVEVKDDESALKLMKVADKYQVLSLKETCSTLVWSAVSCENACELLQIAEQMDLLVLKEKALNYIAKHFKEISKTDGWSEYIVKDSKIVSEIFSHLGDNFEIVPKKKRKLRSDGLDYID